jgi:hypothetical protein
MIRPHAVPHITAVQDKIGKGDWTTMDDPAYTMSQDRLALEVDTAIPCASMLWTGAD